MDRRPLNVAVVGRQFPVPSQTFVLDHITGLLDARVRVTVIADAPSDAVGYSEDYDAYGLQNRTHYFPPRPQGLRERLVALASGIFFGRRAVRALLSRRLRFAQGTPGAWRAFLRAAFINRKADSPDVVHAHFAQRGEELAILKSCGALSAPLVVSVHGFDISKPLNQGLAPYPYLFRYADCVVATTQFLASQVEALGCPREKLLSMPLGIKIPLFDFRERHWAPPQTLFLLSIGRLVEKKGIEYGLRAVARIRAEGIDVRYTIVGEGPLRPRLEQLAAELGIVQCVHFLGALARDALAPHFAACHIFLFPSLTAADGDQEGQGMVLAEAQACGIPVVATRHGGIPEGCLDGTSAILVRERDDAALADGLRELIVRRLEWPAMGRAGRQLVEARYDASHYVDRLIGVYEDLAKSRQKRWRA